MKVRDVIGRYKSFFELFTQPKNKWLGGGQSIDKLISISTKF